MIVRVKAYATLRRYLPGVALGAPIALELPEGLTVTDVLQQLGVPHDEIKLCFVNGRQRELDYCLSDADELAIFPPVGGG